MRVIILEKKKIALLIMPMFLLAACGAENISLKDSKALVEKMKKDTNSINEIKELKGNEAFNLDLETKTISESRFVEKTISNKLKKEEGMSKEEIENELSVEYGGTVLTFEKQEEAEKIKLYQEAIIKETGGKTKVLQNKNAVLIISGMVDEKTQEKLSKSFERIDE